MDRGTCVPSVDYRGDNQKKKKGGGGSWLKPLNPPPPSLRTRLYLVKFHHWIHLRFVFSLLEFEPSERDFLPHVRFFLGNLQNVFLQGFYLIRKEKENKNIKSLLILKQYSVHVAHNSFSHSGTSCILYVKGEACPSIKCRLGE